MLPSSAEFHTDPILQSVLKEPKCHFCSWLDLHASVFMSWWTEDISTGIHLHHLIHWFSTSALSTSWSRLHEFMRLYLQPIKDNCSVLPYVWTHLHVLGSIHFDSNMNLQPGELYFTIIISISLMSLLLLFIAEWWLTDWLTLTQLIDDTSLKYWNNKAILMTYPALWIHPGATALILLQLSHRPSLVMQSIFQQRTKFNFPFS